MAVITLKVRIEMTPQQIQDYADEYGLDPKEVREDLKRYIQNHVRESPALESNCESVTVT